MLRSIKPYPPEFRQQMVELVRAGRTPEEHIRSIRVNDQFRICFLWTGAEAEDVEIVDYH